LTLSGLKSTGKFTHYWATYFQIKTFLRYNFFQSKIFKFTILGCSWPRRPELARQRIWHQNCEQIWHQQPWESDITCVRGMWRQIGKEISDSKLGKTVN
jgi:hypothetical protein